MGDLDETMSPYTSAETSERARQVDTSSGFCCEPSTCLPLPPAMSPRQLWEHELSHDSWSRRDFRQQFLELYVSSLFPCLLSFWVKSVESKLQQRMSNPTEMLETCMDMQLELQRSIKQEVSSLALNRTNGSEMRAHVHMFKMCYELVKAREKVSDVSCAYSGSDSCLLFMTN
ncbi:hypothetical protein SDJN03_06909, partial [Cucurbita argyrosperma subsp. sororia]